MVWLVKYSDFIVSVDVDEVSEGAQKITDRSRSMYSTCDAHMLVHKNKYKRKIIPTEDIIQAKL